VTGRDHIRWLSDAQSLGIPDADLDRLAVDLAAQLDRIRLLDGLDLRESPPGTFFDVRWER
jgi:hypothetical protein